MAQKTAWLIMLMLTFPNMRPMAQDFDWQGHRGCRGLMPENTIPAFLRAVEYDVNTIEMDIVVSKDSNLIVSHEPWMSHQICSHPDGRTVRKKEALSLNIYQMNTAEIQAFDCGTRMHPRFPDQEKIEAHKPTLPEAVKAIRSYCEEHQAPVPAFNIELKSHPDGYGRMIPPPELFVSLAVSELRALGIEDKSTLQSFDINVLEELNRITDRSFRISYLVQNKKKITDNLDKLSFTPDVYSPHHRMVRKKTTKRAHNLGIRVIPWTVNDPKKMAKLIRRKVDGIITDYPNLIPQVERAVQ